MIRFYLRSINPWLAILIVLLFWWAAIKTSLDSTRQIEGLSISLFAAGAFAGLVLFLVGRHFLFAMQRATDSTITEQAESSDDSTLLHHFTEYPDPKTPFSLFQTEWSHFLLEKDGDEILLVANRMHDKFIPFCDNLVGGLKGKKVLELGPFEGFHSHVLVHTGAAPIVSIEGNPRNFLKCLIVKNHYQMDTVNFRLGDFSKFLDSTEERFDFVLAAGVLYHQPAPFRMLDGIMNITDTFGICTTYYDEHRKFFQFTGRTKTVEFDGTEPFELHERQNPRAIKGKKHGLEESAWMFTRDDLLRFLDFRNFEITERNFPALKSGSPRMQVLAQRRT